VVGAGLLACRAQLTPPVAPVVKTEEVRCPELPLVEDVATAADTVVGQTIARVCLLGASLETRATAERSLQVLAGQAVDTTRVREDLAILDGLGRYDEVAAGRIDHAIRITVPRTRKAYVWPARHFASSRTDASLPPMGLWLRLRADFDTSGFPREAQVILEALKQHGAIVADNGSAWYLSGAPDERWDNDALATLRRVPGSAFEAVDTGSLVANPDSGQVR
jgi:hypothetical protein